MDIDGLELASRFSLPPNMRGYCGKPGLLPAFEKFYPDKTVENARRLAAQLETLPLMCTYLETIADANGIDDKFSYENVEAFWIGNRLASKVTRKDAVRMYEKMAARKIIVKERAYALANSLPKKIPPLHHSFHVYITEFVSKKAAKTAANKDKCRPSWGKTIGEGAGRLKILSEPAKFSKGIFSFGKAEPVLLKPIVGHTRLVQKDPGVVAAHWGVAVKDISLAEKSAMKKYTQLTLDAANQMH